MIKRGYSANEAIDCVAMDSYESLGKFVTEVAIYMYSTEFEEGLIDFLADWVGNNED